MPEPAADFLRQVSRLVVENQVRYDSPPQVRRTLDRLVAAGRPREEALDAIAGAVHREVWRVLQGAKFDAKRYRLLLGKLR